MTKTVLSVYLKNFFNRDIKVAKLPNFTQKLCLK